MNSPIRNLMGQHNPFGIDVSRSRVSRDCVPHCQLLRITLDCDVRGTSFTSCPVSVPGTSPCPVRFRALEGTFPTNEAARETTGIEPRLHTFDCTRAILFVESRAKARQRTSSQSEHTRFSPRSIHVGPTELGS
jgi:hypothetical protein